MVVRSFDRRSEMALRRTSSSLFELAGVDPDAEIEALVGQSRHAGRLVLFATLRRLDVESGEVPVPFAPVVRIAAIDCGAAASVVSTLDDGSVVAAVGMLEDRSAAHDLVDQLYVAVHGLERSPGGAVGIGFAIAEADVAESAPLIEQSRFASRETTEARPVMLFTDSMERSSHADVAASASSVNERVDLDVESLVDLRGESPDAFVVTAVRRDDGERQSLSLREAAHALPRIVDEATLFSGRESAPMVWIDATTQDLIASDAAEHLAAVVGSMGGRVGVFFGEAAIAALGETAIVGIDRLSQAGVRVGLREFTGRHLSTHRLAEMALERAVFSPSFVRTIENDPARAFLRQLSAALRKLGIEPMLHGALTELGDMPKAVNVTNVWVAPMADLPDLASLSMSALGARRDEPVRSGG